MKLAVEFVSGADGDLQSIFNRFEDHREGLGVEFMTVVEAYLSRLAAFPQSAPAYLENVRRQVMQGFPYGIFYQHQPRRILVLAILDLRQDEREILRRLRPSSS